MRVITEEQNKMINMVIEGIPLTKIAEELDRSRSTIYNWLSLDYIDTEIENRKAQLIRDAKSMLFRNTNVFIKNIIELANNSKDTRVKFQANKYLLDQIIGAPTTSNEYKKNIDNFKNDDSVVDLKKEIEAIKLIK